MKRTKTTSDDKAQGETNPSRSPRTFLIAMMGSILLWLSFAPVAIWPLAWFAITPWCWLVVQKEFSGSRPYLWIWLAGFLYWLATIYFVPIPHPALWLGWIVFSLYLSLFLPLFIGLSRVLTLQFSCPAWIAVPVIWTGIEYLRSNYVVPFGTILLGHTQYKFPLMIQTADLFGMYTVSFLMAMFSVCVTKIWINRGRGTGIIMHATVAVAVVGGMVGYGFERLGRDRSDPESSVVRLALIQGSIDTEFPSTEVQANALMERHVTQYRDLTWRARVEAPQLDLVVWPESIFLNPYEIPNAQEGSLDVDSIELIKENRENFKYFWEGSTGQVEFGEEYPPPGLGPVAMLTGVGSVNRVAGERYNSAVLIEPSGEVSQLYHKEHLVIMGEFVPFAKYFPILNDLTPIGRGIGRGKGPVCFPFRGLNFAPNICFESTVPHLIRRHVNELADRDQEPDVLLNLTNDGWFFGTACLDHHLACNVFRAVEMRKPMLVCANTGFSAVIDSAGQLKNMGPRREVGILYVNAAAEADQFSLYREYGDWLPGLMGWVCILSFFAGWFGKRVRQADKK